MSGYISLILADSTDLWVWARGGGVTLDHLHCDREGVRCGANVLTFRRELPTQKLHFVFDERYQISVGSKEYIVASFMLWHHIWFVFNPTNPALPNILLIPRNYFCCRVLRHIIRVLMQIILRHTATFVMSTGVIVVKTLTKVCTLCLVPFVLRVKLTNYMSHFSYLCKTEWQNGISHLISELLHTLDSSLRDCLFHVTEWTFPNSLIMQTCQYFVLSCLNRHVFLQ